jgi:hypothetical protein
MVYSVPGSVEEGRQCATDFVVGRGKGGGLSGNEEASSWTAMEIDSDEMLSESTAEPRHFE